MDICFLKFDDTIHATDLVVALGFFDGMHIAHMTLMNKTLEIAKSKNLESGLITFSTHVMSFIKNQPFQHLTNLDEKAKMAKQLGFDHLYVFEVTKELVSLEPELFISRFLVCANTVVVGFDFTFGFRGKGTVELLKKSKIFTTVVLDEMVYDAEKIGSTRIRDAIETGNILLANQLLGYRYTISGPVIRGKGRGKYLGFPTANIDYDGYLLPRPGVYATIITIDEVEYESMANIGDNPTFSDKFVTLEVNIFKFNQSLYGKTVNVAFEKFMRDEIKYESTSELIERMHVDEAEITDTFKKKRS
jgi:riboflavin kinase / FMN adenylyltransferase